MLVLSFIWLSLVTVEPIETTSGVFELLGTIVWIAFIVGFVLRFALVPRKIRFLQCDPITMIARVAPAIRFLRASRLSRGLRLVRILGTANRGFGALQKSFNRRGPGYMLATIAVVIMPGADGMLAFDPAGHVSGGFTSYADTPW